MRQVNNTLSAEIELAAAATIVRKINGQILTDQQVLPAAVGSPGYEPFQRGSADCPTCWRTCGVFRCYDP